MSSLDPPLSAFAAERRCCWAPAPATVDRYLMPVRRSVANPPHAGAAVDRWDRKTDGPTDGKRSTVSYTLHGSAHYAGSVNKIRHKNLDSNEMRATSITVWWLKRTRTVYAYVIFDIACIVCGRVYVTVRCPSVYPSVSANENAAAACGGFAAMGSAGRRYRSFAAWPAPQHYGAAKANSVMSTAAVWRQNTDVYFMHMDRAI